MKKGFLIYSVCWFILLALFNVIVFVTPNEINGISKFSGGFWVGYGFAIATFLGQILCAWFAFKANSNRKFFYNLPLLTISFTALILTAVVSVVFMTVPQIPAWIATIICSVILAFSAISVIKAKATAETVAAIDKKNNYTTSLIRELTAEANIIMMSAQFSETKTEAKKIYEALKFSDPMSTPEIIEIEQEIDKELKNFKKAVENNDSPLVKSIATKLMLLIQERNIKCKALK